MPTDLARIDHISPCVLRSSDIESWRLVLAVMFIDELLTVTDESGVVLEGRGPLQHRLAGVLRPQERAPGQHPPSPTRLSQGPSRPKPCTRRTT